MNQLHSKNLFLFADDLTGACDLAARIAGFIGPVPVAVRPETPPIRELGPVVVNLQTRNLKIDAARTQANPSLPELPYEGVAFLKIDSGLRGNLGATIEGLAAYLKPSRIIVAPAIPSIGRTTRGGIQYDHDIPLHQTCLHDDPDSPVLTADILSVIRSTSQVDCLVCDAATSEDLDRIVRENLNNGRTLFVGSLGLAHSLASLIIDRKPSTSFRRKSERPVIVSGSLYSLTHDQMESAFRTLKGRLLHIDPSVPRAWYDELSNGSEPLFLSIKRERINGDQESRSKLHASFCHIASQILQQMDCDGIGIVGGETGDCLLRDLGVTHVLVDMLVDEVIAVGLMLDGVKPGAPVATKGGSVGSSSAIIQMLQAIHAGKGEAFP